MEQNLDILRQEIVDKSLEAFREGLFSGTSGNMSCRVAPDEMLITPTSVRYDMLRAQDIVRMKFDGDADITAAMDTWYQGGTEIVFACGGGIYTSAAEAAAKVGGKVIGVDVDQKGIIDGSYGEGMTVTSAMKGLAPTVKHLLSEVLAGNFANYGGKIDTLGLVSANPEENYVQIPTASTQFEDGKFTADDYAALVAAMFDGTVTVSNDITAMPAVTNVNVEDLGNLK